MGDPFTGGSHEEWDGDFIDEIFAERPEVKKIVEEKRNQPWNNLCVACRGYPQEHTRDEHCLVGPASFEVGGIVIQDMRMQTSDPGCEED